MGTGSRRVVMRIARWTVGLICGLAIAAAVIIVGPKQTEVCERVGWPNSMFGDEFGAVDADTFSGCDVPTTTTWVVAIVGLVSVTAAIGMRGRR
ncbi:MAG: hypothetical protein HY828_13480 [Actinobacteria bacterium]|nr:hypothetical protein [Actinomycetota bacterium]